MADKILYLMRHGVAEDGPPEDPDRQLTGEGEQGVTGMSKFLKEAGVVVVDCIASSKFDRAVSTAHLVDKQLDAERVVISPNLEPDAGVKEATTQIDKLMANCPKLLVVSHEPLLTLLVKSYLGLSDLSIQFKQGSVMRIDLDDSPGTLRWFVTPKIATD